MFRTQPKARVSFRVFATLAGIALFLFLVRRADPASLLKNIEKLGWGLTLVIALAGVSHVVKTWAWRLTLVGEKGKVSFPRLIALRLAAEAGGQFGMIGQVFGDSMRVSLLSERIPNAGAISSVTLDRGLFFVTGALTSAVGIVAVLFALPISHTLRMYAGVFSAALIGLLLVIALAVRKRWPVFSATARRLGQVRYLDRLVRGKESLIHAFENKLLDFHHNTPGAFWTSLMLNVACHLMAVLEVGLILWLMGFKIGVFGALLIEALTKLVNAAGTFVPGNIGTYEGGTILITKLFGLTAAAGLTLGLSRRLRALFWAAVGGICAVMLLKSKKRSVPGNSTLVPIGAAKPAISRPATQSGREPASDSPAAIILATGSESNTKFISSLARVGTIPISLRAILGAKKAGAGRIIVVVDRNTGPKVQRELLKTGRVPENVEWLAVDADVPLAQTLRFVAALAGRDRVVVIAGDRTYHPTLIRKASEWNEGGVLAMISGKQPIGIYAFASELMLNPPEAGNFEELHAWLTATDSVQCMPVQEALWQHVATAEDRVCAERKLDRWLVKPTDGIFARTNRRISIPISRQLIKFPITPNMVSLITLGFSFASGVFFAFGGYLYILAGALLSLWASILDGCDGEVARLKLQESDFGCWLETVCDYLYYLFIFAGLTIGLFRGSGVKTCVMWGGLLLFGAIASFLATGFSRHRLAAGRPEQLLGIWQTNAEKRRSNPLLYIGRHTEFIIRRCFLPYALVFFALFNLTTVAFVLSAVGANLVWPIALYACYTFAVPRSSQVASPAAPA